LTYVLAILDQLIHDAQLVNVATRYWFYENYLIASVKTTRNKDTGSGTAIEIELHEVRFVTTLTVAEPDLPTLPENTKPVNKGVQNPKPPLQSVAVGVLKGWGVVP
jgi:hypothetical protein